MSVDHRTVKRIAHLARIGVADEELAGLSEELNAILSFVEELSSLDVAAVEPMTSVIPMGLRMRADEVTDHAGAEAIVANAPFSEDRFFVVPRVVE